MFRKTGGIFSFFGKLHAASRNGKIVSADQKLVLSLSQSRIPKFRQLKHIGKFLSPKEKWLLYGSVAVFSLSFIFWATNYALAHLQVVPKRSGVYSEGLIGSPKHINPLYAKVNDADNDLIQLVYSSLFKRDKNGALAKDLVENYSVSEDKKTYTIQIKRGVKFHNGSELTANDVYFTFNAIKDVQYKSPLRSGFTGVSLEVDDDYQFRFILASPYAAFYELLTFGIMPAELWSLVPPEAASLAELNLKPIGSGPYKYEQLSKEKKLGTIKDYQLSINEDYYGSLPYVGLDFKFYGNFSEAITALNNKEINGISYLPTELKAGVANPKSFNYHKLYMPQMTALFLNQKANPALADKSVRQALALALDKNEIINSVLGGEAYAASGPILPNSFAYYPEINKYEYDSAKAAELLVKTDWQPSAISAEQAAEAERKAAEENAEIGKETQDLIILGAGNWRKKNGEFLKVRLTTIDRAENQAVAEKIKHYWEQIGVKTEIEIVPSSQIQAKTIKPRQFEVLFYGQALGADPDPYSFWHSSQTGENGFNIAGYMNKEVDKLLEDARITDDMAARQEKYRQFQKIFTEDLPAIFVYSPTYTYLQDNELKGFDVKNIFNPSDRFSNMEEWYLETKKTIEF